MFAPEHAGMSMVRKNSNYFLNLEKGNHIKKHIRKLYISGTISTDPFQIIDPLSPYLFIIAAEILAIAIQTKTDIQGHKIGKEEFKLVQYADDLTVFVPNVACAQLVAQSTSILFWFKSKLH